MQSLAVKQALWESTVQKPEENQRCVLWCVMPRLQLFGFSKICCLY